MIKKIDITKFALFNEFSWDKTIGNDNSFKAVNIIYGRNYSGKTTLSRIFRCIEKGEIHRHYPDAKFSISLSDKHFLSQDNINPARDDIKIRVYNTDFVKDNLSWLHKDDGSIEPFTLLGSINIELDKQIKDIEENLGKEDDKKGLFFELSEKTEKHKQQNNIYDAKTKALDDLLRKKAGDIKNNANLYNEPNYTIVNIKKDIPNITETSIISDDAVREKKNQLKEESKADISKLHESKPKFLENYNKTKTLLTKEIKPTQPIIDLINDKLLQEWVRQGIEKHKDKRDACGFCGNPISEDLWSKLDAHFSKESEALREEINAQIALLKTAQQGINNYLKLDKDSLYASLHIRCENLLKSWQTLKTSYSNNLEYLINELQAREKDIFTVRTAIEVDDISEDIVTLFKQFNQLIEEHNKKTTTLNTDQKNARCDLRLSEVAAFLQTIEYKNKLVEIEKLKNESLVLEKKKTGKELEVKDLIERKRVLIAQAKDESKGAELVNQYLTRFFGHDGLTLVAEGESPAIQFKIMRDGAEANNLSEGECSLIAFCYFIAKMEDELNNYKLIIYIDDPISSLDSNHVFFMFSLIESVIAKPKKYDQLFISTHNLDFLKYLKRITVPFETNSRKKDVAHFLIERERKQKNKRSVLTKMPDHIKNYSTEFNYLFGQIYAACKEGKGDKHMMLANTYNQFYNLPNNLRKFLECYLFFKYPNNDDPLENLDKLFDGHVPSLINRIINENSHLTHIDRAWKPMDIDEVEDCARLVIEKIKEIDPDQFEALVASLK
jgi:wobble nucleotide-excising tRNase